MNKTTIVSALSLGLLAGPLALTAKTSEEAYVESYRGRSDIPAPVSVVTPEIEYGHGGTVVELVFVVDETGKPDKIEAREGVDAGLAREVIAAVAQWRFTPARDAEGRLVARKVYLPVHIVDKPGDRRLFAAK